jgi:cation-transporting ATPase 13A2
VPFVVTITLAFFFSIYMLFDPSEGFAKFMQLTYLSTSFKLFILALSVGGFGLAWVSERNVFLWLAKLIGKTHDRIWPHRMKKRKEYKVLAEKMRI